MAPNGSCRVGRCETCPLIRVNASVPVDQLSNKYMFHAAQEAQLQLLGHFERHRPIQELSSCEGCGEIRYASNHGNDHAPRLCIACWMRNDTDDLIELDSHVGSTQSRDVLPALLRRSWSPQPLSFVPTKHHSNRLSPSGSTSTPCSPASFSLPVIVSPAMLSPQSKCVDEAKAR